ncbi:MAG: hypothetical protein K8R21_07185 [Leptospira sp.]|nr:hypothetical protein [Leptospira sp.]
MSEIFSIDQIKGQDTALKYLQAYVSKPDKLESNSCGKCTSCRAFMQNAHPDNVVFPINQNKGIPIGDEKDPAEYTIRWLQKSRLIFRPHLSRFRFILFPDASLINNEAETAMLKILEEPPFHSKFIFIIDDLGKLKQTIVSRGLCIPFGFLPQKIVKDINLKRNIQAEPIFGGSVSPLPIPGNLMQILKDKIEISLDDSILLFEFEKWVKEYRDDHPEWEEDFDYTEFLECVTSLMMYHFTMNDYEKNIRKIESIFEFKNALHNSVTNIEPFLFSRLIFRISLL